MVDAKSIYGTGSSSAHAYYVTKWRTTYTQYRQILIDTKTSNRPGLWTGEFNPFQSDFVHDRRDRSSMHRTQVRAGRCSLLRS